MFTTFVLLIDFDIFAID